MSLLELFCHVDDFWKSFAPDVEPDLLDTGQRQAPASWAPGSE